MYHRPSASMVQLEKGDFSGDQEDQFHLATKLVIK